jgi:hypothetical protein
VVQVYPRFDVQYQLTHSSKIAFEDPATVSNGMVTAINDNKVKFARRIDCSLLAGVIEELYI